MKHKGESEIALDIASLAETMRRHVDRELARARLSYSAKSASASIRMVVDRVVRVVERTPAGQKLNWTIDIPDDLRARIDGDDLAEVLGNLIENAARHAKRTVAISAAVEDDSVAIAIADDGHGIAEEDWPDVMERGGRLDTRTEGAGLGLAIATDILDAWGGTLTLGNANPGLTVSLCLPVSGA